MIICFECNAKYKPMTDAYRCPVCGESNYPDDEDYNGVQCCECDQESVGYDRDGSPYCAAHMNRFRRVSGEFYS